jgi:transposase
MSVYVGIDVHRKRSQVAVVTGDGTVQLNKNVVNGSEPMLRLIGGLPADTPVAFEAAYGWGWLVELLEDYGFDPHLVHPLRCKAIASARPKNDKGDAAILTQLLRADPLPEAWIAPPPVRQLRAQLRHRASPVRLGTQLRNRIHAVAADHGYDRTGSYWTGPGRGWLAELDLPAVSREIITDSLAFLDALAPVIERLDGELHQHAKADPRVKILRTLPGVGEFTALVMLAEIGDITRFASARKLASWAGLTSTVRGSDLTVRHGHISKQGSAWLRWVLNQAAQTAKRSPEFAATYAAITKRRGKKIATIAISRNGCHSDVMRISCPLYSNHARPQSHLPCLRQDRRERGLHQDAAEAAQAQATRRRRGLGRRKSAGAARRLVPRLLAAGLRCPPTDSTTDA